jgi:hypothetical protein
MPRVSYYVEHTQGIWIKRDTWSVEVIGNRVASAVEIPQRVRPILDKLRQSA